MSLSLSPLLPDPDLTDQGLAYPKSLGYTFLLEPIRGKLAYFCDLICSQLGHPVIRSSDPLRASLGDAVSPVFSSRTQKQMRRLKTTLVVAPMADIETFGDFSYEQAVRDTVRPQFLAPILNLPIPIWEKAARPFKATIARVRANHLLKQFVAGNLITHLRALPGSSLLDPICVEPRRWDYLFYLKGRTI